MNCPVSLPPAWLLVVGIITGTLFAIGMIRFLGITGLIIVVTVFLVLAIFAMNTFTGLHAQGC